jgi:hypothetical protein
VSTKAWDGHVRHYFVGMEFRIRLAAPFYVGFQTFGLSFSYNGIFETGIGQPDWLALRLTVVLESCLSYLKWSLRMDAPKRK